MIAAINCGRRALVKFSITGKRTTPVFQSRISPSISCRYVKGDGMQQLTYVDSSDVYVSKRAVKYKLSTGSSKCLLNNIYSLVCAKVGSNHLKPSFHCSQLKGKLWKATLTLQWPTTFVEEGIASQKKTAEAIVAKKAIEWLHQQKVLDENGHPILYTQEEKRALIQTWNQPCEITIAPDVERNLENLLNKYKEIEPKLSCYDELIHEPKFADSKGNDENGPNIIDIITGEKYKRSDPDMLDWRNYEMLGKLKEKAAMPEYHKFKKHRELLPITNRRKDILSLIRDNPVIVLSGETGCGKTTQVPQFILDECISSGEGSNCNMVVTQPRRISAISMAHRVANERCERLGETIGFQVRLEKKIPKRKGSVLFCTTGILLRRMQQNPYLEGISHVIVDEVHERSIEIDLLLTLLRKALERNKTVKIILMSATINAKIFSRYFDNCPTIEIPGFTYPVRQYFLEDVYRTLRRRIPTQRERKDNVNIDLVTELICEIDSNCPHGAILCFFPGWQEIKETRNKLQNLPDGESRFSIFPLHSLLPHYKQSLVFESAPPGKRKVILATNIAETSITINDVVYVIDSGCHNELTYNSNRGISTLLTNPISKANIQQRKGRAGRVQPGECFHLFTKKDMDNMEEFPVPEISRASLENVVLNSKMYCTEESAAEFLSKTPEPPPVENVKQAVKDLQILGLLDNEEKLTMLGRCAVFLSTHPRLSKALITSVIFRCLDPVLTITAMLSAGKNPFDIDVEDRKAVREIKAKYNASYPSDLLSFANLFKEWSTIPFKREAIEFCKENSLKPNDMKFIQDLKELLLEQLAEAKLLNRKDKNIELPFIFNEYSSDQLMVLSVLTNAFYPKIFRIKQGSVERGQIKWEKTTFTSLDGKPAKVASDSVICKLEELPSKFITSFTEVGFHERMSVVKDNSAIPEIMVLVCTGRYVKMMVKKDIGLLEIDGKKRLVFSALPDQCEMLMTLRDCFSKVVQWSLCHSNDIVKDDAISIFIGEFMKTFTHLMQNSQNSLHPVQKEKYSI